MHRLCLPTAFFRSLLALLFLAAACTPAAPTAAPIDTQIPASVTAAVKVTPLATQPPAPAANPLGWLAPAGDPGKTYYAPFPIAIVLDGELGDWQAVPRVTVPAGADLSSGRPAITFAAAADNKTLYLMADVTKQNIISGKHDTAYWNEDSVEFYLNGTGNLGARNYTDGIAQITIPALDIDRSPKDAIIAGVNGTTVDAQVAAKKTASGYVVEVAVPLVNKVWSLTAAHGNVVGFQVHLNGATTADRDIKLIWSAADQSDASYKDPSVFGQLIFYQVGQTDQPMFQPTATAQPTATFPPPLANAAYKNPKLPVEDRVNDLLSQMSLTEKIGQMTLVEKNSLPSTAVSSQFIGGVLSGGGGYPIPNTPERWARMVERFQKYALGTRLGIPLIYGVDAVHGHNNVASAVIFPHNIGLGAAGDEELMQRIGRVTAAEMVGTGIYWDYAPVVAVPQDIRWGRTYEGYSENTDLVSRLGVAYLKGLQGDNLADPTSVLATLKHYLGDGGTAWGTSTTGGYKLDQGVTQADEAALRALYLPPYIAGLQAGAQSVMISYSSWGGLKMHAQKYLVTDVLKGELGFQGFVVSDWAGFDQISSNSYINVVTAINAGIDMNMVPYDYGRFISLLTQAVKKGDVPQARIDDAARRILRVKFQMGLFEHPNSNPELLAQVGSAEHRAVAREAVSKSLVLLKNEAGALPLSKTAPLIYVAGMGANDIGMQCGGWTIEWQGKLGDITAGTTLLQAITSTVSAGTTVTYDPAGKFAGSQVADACVAVVGEAPYAEGVGDKEDLTLTATEVKMTANLRNRCKKLVVVLYSGRPMVIAEPLQQWDALVAAWLPGTEGQGIADVLFGDRPFTGKLPYTWPRSNDQLPFDFKNLGSGDNGPLFPFGFGLNY